MVTEATRRHSQCFTYTPLGGLYPNISHYYAAKNCTKRYNHAATDSHNMYQIRFRLGLLPGSRWGAHESQRYLGSYNQMERRYLNYRHDLRPQHLVLSGLSAPSPCDSLLPAFTLTVISACRPLERCQRQQP